MEKWKRERLEELVLRIRELRYQLGIAEGELDALLEPVQIRDGDTITVTGPAKKADD